MSKRRDRVNAQLDALYAELPKIECRRRCQTYCGPVAMADTEWQRIIKQVGRVPQPTATLQCPMLTAKGNCGVYEVRPMLCRIWGIVENMRCPWGCQPSPRYLTVEEAFAFMLASGAMGKPIPRHEAQAFLRLLTPAQKEEIRRLTSGRPPRELVASLAEHAGPYQGVVREMAQSDP